jgi:hypothetical protein
MSSDTKEHIFLISIILSFGFGIYTQYSRDYRETHRWELIYKTPLTLHEENWIDGIKRSCWRAKKDSLLKCKTTIIPDKELREHWDSENAKTEAAIESDADRPIWPDN